MISDIEKAAQLVRAARVLELVERLGLDLSYALTRHRELLADLLQRVVGVRADAEAHPQNALLARGQGCQRLSSGPAQVGLDHGVDRHYCVLVLDEVAEVAAPLVTDRGFQADRLLGDPQDLLRAVLLLSRVANDGRASAADDSRRACTRTEEQEREEDDAEH